MKPQIVNAKMNRLLFRGKVIKAMVLAAVVFSVVMMTGYRKFDTTVLITDRGVTREIKTNESDVYEILRAENYELGEEDRVSYTKDDKEGHITIRRAFDVTVTADGETRTITTIGGKVEDILEKAGVTLGETDTIDPALDKSVSADTKITVTRIRYLERTTTAEIPFETEYVDDPNLAMGNEETVAEGVNGIRTTVFRDTYVNDKRTTSEQTSSRITTKPANEVIKRGTALATPYNQNNTPEDLKLVNGIPESYTRVVSGKATAYSAYPGARTASGRYAVVGTVAVNPNVIPYGSELYIVSHDGRVYGYAIAADTGLGMMDGTVAVDLFMASYADSCRWGAHYVDIYVISEGMG